MDADHRLVMAKTTGWHHIVMTGKEIKYNGFDNGEGNRGKKRRHR